jgi:hypothetical protein
MLLRRALPPAHFDRNATTPVTDPVHSHEASISEPYGRLDPLLVDRLLIQLLLNRIEIRFPCRILAVEPD